MKNLFAICSISLLLLLSLSACDDCETEVNKIRIISLEPQFVKIDSISTTIEGGDTYFYNSNYAIDSAGITFDSLGISIYNNLESFSRRNNFSLINSAYACDPVYYFYGIDSMYIYSDQAYDANHPAGSNLRDLVGFRNGYSVVESKDNEIQGSICFINFKSAPDQNKTHVLTIKYRLSNGNTTTSVLPKVKILKP